MPTTDSGASNPSEFQFEAAMYDKEKPMKEKESVNIMEEDAEENGSSNSVSQLESVLYDEEKALRKTGGANSEDEEQEYNSGINGAAGALSSGSRIGDSARKIGGKNNVEEEQEENPNINGGAAGALSSSIEGNLPQPIIYGPPVPIFRHMANINDEENALRKTGAVNNVEEGREENSNINDGAAEALRSSIEDYLPQPTIYRPPIPISRLVADVYDEEKVARKTGAINNVKEEREEYSYVTCVAARAPAFSIAGSRPQPIVGSSSLQCNAESDDYNSDTVHSSATGGELSMNDSTSPDRTDDETGTASSPSASDIELSPSAGEEEGRESLPVLEATLVDDNEARVTVFYQQLPAEPIYQADQIEITAIDPWWKRNQGYLITGFLLLMGATVIGVIVMVFVNDREDDGVRTISHPTLNGVSSISPSLLPSSLDEGDAHPSQATSSPLPSRSPSVPPLIWEKLGEVIYGLTPKDDFGNSVALSADGMTLVVGAPVSQVAKSSTESDGTLYYSAEESAEQFRVFGWNTSTLPLNWTQIGSTVDGEARDRSGWAVDISADGKIVVVGAYFYGRCDVFREDCFSSGQVKVYKYDECSMGWNQLGSSIDGEDENDTSGRSVALSSDGLTVAIGAPANGGNGLCSGHVRVYKWVGSDWSQVGQDIDGHNAGDGAGHSVALNADGSILAIGSPFSGDYSGMVQVYQWNDDSFDWTPLGQGIEGENEHNSFGHSVALSLNGMALAVGAIYNDGNGTIQAGHTRVYQWDSGNNWHQAGQDIDGEADRDRSGWSIDLSADGKTVAIGATFNDGNGVNSGHVRVYQWDEPSSDWNQLGQDIDGSGVGAMAGQSVRISADGSTVAFVSIGSDMGQTHVFHITGQ